ncbi:MAG TPA: SpoIIE family protein phosphatase [Acidimicrobiales bacterium]|nr:SpoIIE family protein phosphatase [Acidimicrobiales bacterium]
MKTPRLAAPLTSLAFLAEASAVLGTSLDPATTLGLLAELSVPRLADWCVVYLVDGGGELRPVAHAPAGEDGGDALAALVARYPESLTAALDPAAVVASGETAVSDGPTDSELRRIAIDDEHLDLLRRLPMTALVAVPLSARGRQLGCLCLGAGGPDLGGDEVALAEELGCRAGLAVDNARLYHEMVRAKDAARFQAALLRAQSEAGLDGSLIVSPEGEMISHNHRFAEIWGLTDDVLGTRSDAAALARAVEQVVDPEAFLARVGEVYRRRPPRTRDEIELRDGRVLERFGAPLHGDDGSYYGWAWHFRDVSNERRAERALIESRERFATLARTLQQSLLPPALPEIPGAELAARYHPAGSGLEIGGDFYDVFRTGRGRWGIVVGDVCGKGAEAARFTALARYTVRAASMTAPGPAQVLDTLNRAMLRQNDNLSDDGVERFATVAYASLRRIGGRLSLILSSGGHPCALVVRSSGRVEPVAAQGMALGLFPGADLREARISLSAGDSLVLYTDGVTEARTDGVFFGEERLMEELGRRGGSRASELAEALERAVLDHQGGEAADDIAILVVAAR